MNSYDYDLVVIGAGSGGVRASRMAAAFGARVAVIEERYLGGTCVNVGCVPKKLFVYGSHFKEDFEQAAGYGWRLGEPTFEWSGMLGNKDREIARLNGVYGRMLDGAGVEVIDGRGTVVGPHAVQVGDRTLSTGKILIATGSWPHMPELPGIEHAITSNEAFHLTALPERVLVVGGGYIAVEFAGIFQGLGSQVTQIYRGEQFLRNFDGDVRTHVAVELRKKGIDLRFSLNVLSIRLDGDTRVCTLTDGSELRVDCVLMATGRLPLSRGLGLEEVGVALSGRGGVVVDANFVTSVPSILAVGDVIDHIQLTPVALAEGMFVARYHFGGLDVDCPDYRNIPTAVFCQPTIGTVGLTEEEARMDHDVVIYRSTFKPMKLTMTSGDERTLMKLVVDRQTDRVLGCHMVGPAAGEIIQGLAVAMKCGATKAAFDATIGIHPTAAEEFVTMRTPVAE